MSSLSVRNYRLFCVSVIATFVSFVMSQVTNRVWQELGGMERGNLQHLGLWACAGGVLSLIALALSFFGNGWKRLMAIAANLLLFVQWQPLFHWLRPNHNPS